MPLKASLTFLYDLFTHLLHATACALALEYSPQFSSCAVTNSPLSPQFLAGALRMNPPVTLSFLQHLSYMVLIVGSTAVISLGFRLQIIGAWDHVIS